MDQLIEGNGLTNIWRNQIRTHLVQLNHISFQQWYSGLHSQKDPYHVQKY